MDTNTISPSRTVVTKLMETFHPTSKKCSYLKKCSYTGPIAGLRLCLIQNRGESKHFSYQTHHTEWVSVNLFALLALTFTG